MFTEQLPDFLDYVNSLPGFICPVGDMNIHFDNPLQTLTKQTLNTLSLYGLVQVINEPTHRCGHIIDWVIVQPDDDIHRKSTVIDSLESDHYCTKSNINISVSKTSTLYRTARNIANIHRPHRLPRRHRSSRGVKRKKQNLHSFIVASLNAQSVNLYVSLCNHCSDFAPVHSSVHQGSVLGPMLFTMYIKPLSAIIDSHSIIHHSFAD